MTELKDRSPDPAFFVRVAVPAKLVVTVRVLPEATKKEVIDSVQKFLRAVTDAEDAIKIRENTLLYAADGKLHFDKKVECTQDSETIFTLKGLDILDAFSAPVEDEPRFKEGS